MCFCLTQTVYTNKSSKLKIIKWMFTSFVSVLCKVFSKNAIQLDLKLHGESCMYPSLFSCSVVVTLKFIALSIFLDLFSPKAITISYIACLYVFPNSWQSNFLYTSSRFIFRCLSFFIPFLFTLINFIYNFYMLWYCNSNVCIYTFFKRCIFCFIWFYTVSSRSHFYCTFLFLCTLLFLFLRIIE